MKNYKKIGVVVLLLVLIIFISIKAINNRKAITETKFISFLSSNDYVVVSTTSHSIKEEVKNNSKFTNTVKEITANLNSSNVSIDYYSFNTVEEAMDAYNELISDVYAEYFITQTNKELMKLTSKEDYVKESSGDNYNRYIIKNPERDQNTIVSRIDKTLIVSKDVQDQAFTKVKEVFGKMGY